MSTGADDDGFGETHEVLPSSSITPRHKSTLIQQFQLSRREILRASHAHKVLWHHDLLRRSSAETVDLEANVESFHSLSFVVNKVDDFWSHSWHGAAVPKIVTLYLHYNAIAGTICSMILSATTAWLLISTSHLHEDAVALCCILAGVVGLALGMLCWMSRRLIFLDKVSISQTDAALKDEGIACIGGFLSHTDTLLVLWDPSYLCRLWCLYEYITFAYLASLDTGKHILVRPTFHGSFTAWLMVSTLCNCVATRFFSLTSVVVDLVPEKAVQYMMIVAIVLPTLSLIGQVRRFAREVAAIKEQARCISISESQCFCCSCGHMHPMTGATLPCDRDYIYPAIALRSGSLEIGNEFLRESINSIFKLRIGLPYRTVLFIGLPMAWVSIGMAAIAVQGGRSHATLGHLNCASRDVLIVFIGRAKTLFFALPICLEVFVRVGACFKRQCANAWLDGLLSLCATAPAIILIGGYLFASEFMSKRSGCSVGALCCGAAVELAVTFVLYRGRFLV
eukprot:TRINITY_DN2296_c4_g1_i1.p1 TRINITY_DN2296_c4_g1~~TRINITY_DN2296_c4_g1_i1.p1  ORF type:complete len:509 (-),score=27.08 TRINITY_DN2296_c4_g1_i1:183-1709(-)